MKGIHSSKRILFINILCLLWLPNYCDIKQNEADSKDFQTDKSVSSDSSDIRNVPSDQEKENYIEVLENSIKKMAVQPNVEYVNSIENKEVEITNEAVENSDLAKQAELSEEIQQQVHMELESSRLSNSEVKDEPSTKVSEVPESSDKPEVDESVITHSTRKTGPMKLVLTSPSAEPSLTRQSLEKSIKLMEAMPKPVISNSLELDLSTNAREAAKMPQPVPTNAELNKHILEEGMHQQPHYDGMPSFDEWKKMMLAEQEKGGQKMPSPAPPGKKISSQKRRRNYSSYECGAKIVASNSEGEGTSRILNELVDEYMLNPCKAKIWFVLELCESVQATQIELANFELFSSCPKDFAVYSSDNFPTRDWILLGTFTAAEQRVLQSFELKQEGFGKFIKIELLSHYGNQHYCPLSVVRIFGTSMVDEYEEMEMEKSASHPTIPDDDLDRLDIAMEDKKASNIFGSATDAVISIVKKAAQALGQHHPSEDGQVNDTISDPQNMSESKLCKVIDNSSNKCEDIISVSKSDKLETLHNFSISPSSMHQSLFRLLHRCDQCISSRIRYYSSAQPHCRFFQAAFGPIVLQRICDWFKEHPLVFAHESATHRNKVPPHSDPLVPSPTKSPPPQIMVVPLDNDTSIKKLLLKGNLSLGSLNKSVINATKTLLDTVNDSEKLQDKFQLEASMQPTHVQKVVHNTVFNDSNKNSFVGSNEAVPPIVHTVSKISSEPFIATADETPASHEKIVLETGTIEASVTTDLPTASELFSEVDEEQMKEFISDSISATEDMSLPEIPVTSTELPSSLKQSEEKTSDVRIDNQGKLEPVSISGVSTASQKESVFMRMSNRIKSLELNMSLSSQYLQELSQRYRRQMEEMQRAFNRTIGTLNDTARKAAEKDIRQQEILNSLQLQVGNLTETVEMLLSERSSIFRQMIETHVCLMVIEAIIMVTLMSLYVRRISSSVNPVPREEKEQVVVSARLSKRRSSVDSCTPPVARKVKKRSASEEGLNAGEEPLIIEPLPVLLDPILKVKKKNRKRNRVQRSSSHPSVQRRNSSPTSQCTANRASHSEGCMLINVRSKHQIHGKDHPCENCNNNTCTEIISTEREKRWNGAPFQNLTNGTLPSTQEQSAKSQRSFKGKDKFSFRKFLKFQKRDSI